MNDKIFEVTIENDATPISISEKMMSSDDYYLTYYVISKNFESAIKKLSDLGVDDQIVSIKVINKNVFVIN